MEKPISQLMNIIHKDTTGESRELLMPLVNTLRGISLHMDGTPMKYITVRGVKTPCTEEEYLAWKAGYDQCLVDIGVNE